MPPDIRKKSPSGLGSKRAGEEKIDTFTLVPCHDVYKPRPRPVHPFAKQLRNDRDYVWRRMLASVCPAEFFEDYNNAK